MFYKPNFCCNCGEKVERVDWNLLTSRRFCDVCSIENRRYDVVPRMAVAGGILALMFGFGTLWRGSSEGQHQPLPLPATLKGEQGKDRGDAVPGERPDSTVPEPGHVPGTLQSASEVTRLEQKPSDPKLYCGALTKKGTPCSRKVKARGTRCFQHEGRPEAPPIN